VPGGLSTVYIGNVATGTLAPIPSPTSGAHDTSPRLSPDGSQVAFLRNVSTAGLNRSDLWVAPVTCGGQATCASARQLTSKSNISNNAVRNRPCWSPTGDALMFNVFLSSSLTYQVDKITLSSGQVTAITGKSQNRVALDWQP
jgi:Tol biopolymer transport system component